MDEQGPEVEHNYEWPENGRSPERALIEDILNSLDPDIDACDDEAYLVDRALADSTVQETLKKFVEFKSKETNML